MIKPDIIKKHIEGIYSNLDIPDKSRAMDIEQFKSDKTLMKASEHCLQLAIQSLLDICHYIIANNNLPRPDDNREAILAIANQGIIPKKFAEKIAPMANMRNLLVHEYLEINPKKIHAALQNLEDFREFSRYILKYIEK